MILGAALALLLFAGSPAASPPLDAPTAWVTGRDVRDVELPDPAGGSREEAQGVLARVVLYALRPAAPGAAADVARALLAGEQPRADGVPVMVVVVDRAGRRAGVAAADSFPLAPGVVPLVAREVEADLARGHFNGHADEVCIAMGRAIWAAAPDRGAELGGGSAGRAGPVPSRAESSAEEPPEEPPEEPFEPLWSTGPRWLFGLVAGIVAILLWATGTPVVRGRDWALAVVRSVIPLFIAAFGVRLLFGPRFAVVFGACLAAALFLARLALGPARRREDARAPGPIGWLGEVVFAIASQLLVIAVQVVVDILISALLEAIFGGGGSGGGSSWGGGGGAFSGGGASGSW